jgi:dihydropyrimidine dehydrogenase (NAD+) subunit PreA
MTPNVTSMNEIVKVCLESDCIYITAINTIKGITSINLENFSGNPNVNNKSSISRISGRAVKPIGLRFIHELYSDNELKKFSPQYCGVGGIYDWQDALEYISLGSSCVQICTAVMEFGYSIIKELLEKTTQYLLKHNTNVTNLIGCANKNIVYHANLDRVFKCKFKIDNKKCTKCKRCLVSCNDSAKQAIQIKNNILTINQEKCSGCGLCSLVCPCNAIIKL